MTPLQRHLAEWRDCQRCPLHVTRCKTSLLRGTIPCDILFVGEGPGKSEDILGKPFQGPAGHLLDKIVARAVPTHITTAYTNLLACIPLDADTKKKQKTIPVKSVVECRPRLQELIDLAQPTVIVCVGTDASKWVGKMSPSQPLVHIAHPSAILQTNNYAQKDLMCDRCVVRIEDAIQEHVIPF